MYETQWVKISPTWLGMSAFSDLSLFSVKPSAIKQHVPAIKHEWGTIPWYIFIYVQRMLSIFICVHLPIPWLLGHQNEKQTNNQTPIWAKKTPMFSDIDRHHVPLKILKFHNSSFSLAKNQVVLLELLCSVAQWSKIQISAAETSVVHYQTSQLLLKS